MSLHLTRTPLLYEYLHMSECLVMELVKLNGIAFDVVAVTYHTGFLIHQRDIGKPAFGKGFLINGGCTMMMVHYRRWDFT